MSQRLASDDDNPDFAGARNPDSALAVRFFSRPVQNSFESEKAGRPIYQDMDYIEIMRPGDPTSIIVTAAREDHKRRFPMHWAHYQNTHGGDARELGTPLSQWPRLSQSQVEELRALKFFTVESVANASDANIQRLGMIAGKSAYVFRDDAVRFLRVANEDASVKQAEDRAKALEEEARVTKEENDKKFAEMQAQIAALSAPKKRGRKPKVVAE